MFKLTLVSILALAGAVQAAECYGNKGGSHNGDDIYGAREQVCNGGGNAGGDGFSITASGPRTNCWQALDNIIHQCASNGQSGYWFLNDETYQIQIN